MLMFFKGFPEKYSGALIVYFTRGITMRDITR